MNRINQIISVGSVDGVLTSAALLRLIGRDDVGLQFTQAFSVDKVDVTKFPEAARVALVDLAVNNRDPSMTAGFIARLQEAGHQVVAVIDEHSREDWIEIVGQVPNTGCYHTAPDDEYNRHHDSFFVNCEACCSNSLPREFEGLIIEPQSQAEGTYKSSGAVLAAAANDLLDTHGVELCQAADAGDRMDFTTHFGAIVNQAVKSDISNDARRVYLARHLAQNAEADDTIRGWMVEYEQILADHDIIVAAATDLGGGIIRVNTTGRKVDVTTLMARLYRSGARVVISEGELFVPDLKMKKLMIAFGTSEKIDILAAVKAAGVPASGFAQKANVDLADEAGALVAIRALLG